MLYFNRWVQEGEEKALYEYNKEDRRIWNKFGEELIWDLGELWNKIRIIKR